MPHPDFSDFLERARDCVSERRRDGGHARSTASAHADLYGTSAAVGILIALGETPTGAEAASLRRDLRAFEGPDGLFADATHGEIHRAATALTTLAALGEKVRAPDALHNLLRADAAADFLEGLDWDHPWPASHDAAGLLAIGIVAERERGDGRREWLQAYLHWLDGNADETTGLWRRGRMLALSDDPGLFGNLGCSFHFHFLYERLNRPWPVAPGVVDTGLELLHTPDAVLPLDVEGAAGWGFRQLDWSYSVGRAAQRGHRSTEVIAELHRLAARAAVAFADPDAASGDLHVLQARVGLVAELAHLLPGALDTGSFSLTPIVDMRAFI